MTKPLLTLFAALSATVLSDAALYAQTPTIPPPSVQTAGAQQTPPLPTPQPPVIAQANCGQPKHNWLKLVRFQAPPLASGKLLRLVSKTGVIIDPSAITPGSIIKPKPCPAIPAAAASAPVVAQAGQGTVSATTTPTDGAAPIPQPHGVATGSKQ